MGATEEMSLRLLLLLLISTIGSQGQSNDPKCTMTCDQQICDISEEMERLKSDNTFCMMAGNYILKKTVMLTNISNVSIVGIGGMANISCMANISRNSTAGMAIINVRNFWMEDITLFGCTLTGEMWDQKIAPMIEGLLNFTNIYYIPGKVGKSLTIIASHDVTLNRVNVQNSVGVGLLALNMIGQCSLLNCTFDNITDDNCSQSSNDLRCISGAAMFYLTDSTNSNVNALPDDNYILIDDCRFQNSISHSNYVALELRDGIFRLNASARIVNNQSLYPLDGSAGLSVIMDRHYADSRQYFIVRNSQ